MNGAEKLIQTAAAAGTEVCFTNPGTTEMLLVAALDTVPGVRGVLAMFEGVVTGAADGYGRMADKPALTLLHLGPGFANGIANLHNARRARTPIVNLIGHHATWQRNFDPPLNSDVEKLAAAVSGWQRTNSDAGHISRDTADAIGASLNHPGQVATLIVPGDSQWNDAPERVFEAPPSHAGRIDVAAVEKIRQALAGERTLLLLGQTGLRDAGLRAAGRISKATGCQLMSETFPKRMERGPHLPALPRLPYFPEQAIEALSKFEHVVLAGCSEPASFFGYEDGPDTLIPDNVTLSTLAGPLDDAAHALELLAEALDAPADFDTPQLERPPRPSGEISATAIAQALVSTMPESSIVIDEGVTSAGAVYPISANGPAHSFLALTGGAIGFGMPAGVGAAIACPDRQVIVLEGDGSGLYTCQALWTQAREGLNVVNVVFNNSVYRILQVELLRAGITEPGPQALHLTELSKPAVQWTTLSESFGVPATRVESADELTAALENAFAEDGPHTVEVMIPSGAAISPP